MMQQRNEQLPPSDGRRRAVIVGSAVALVFLFVAVLLVNRSAEVRTTTTTTAASTTGSTSTTATTTASTAASTTSTTPPATATTGAVLTPPDTSPAVWPVAASGTRYLDPASAARGFAVDFVFRDPVVSAPTLVGDRSVVIELRPDGGGPVTYVQVHQLDGASTWWVTGATTTGLVPAQPASGETVNSPAHLSGRSTAFEATFRAEIREDGNPSPLASSPVMGGSNGDMGPYETALVYAMPSTPYGTVVLTIPSMKDGSPLQVSVTRIRFADAAQS